MENCELPSGKTCELVGGSGTKSKIECEGEVMFCNSVCQGEMCEIDDEDDGEEDAKMNKAIEEEKKEVDEADKEEFGKNGPTFIRVKSASKDFVLNQKPSSESKVYSIED